MPRAKEGEVQLGGPRAMSRVLNLFWFLSAREEGATLAEIAAELGAPKSTLRDTLPALLADGYLVAPEGRFRLGPRAFRLGARLISRWSLPMNARPFLRELAQKTGESVALAQIDREARRFIFIDVVESTHGVRFVMQPGRGDALYVGASGRVLLAFQDPEYCEAYLQTAPFRAVTPRTVTSAEGLRRILEDVRREGVAVSLGESIKDGLAIAAPIFGPRGKVVAALTVAGPTARLEPRIQHLKSQVVAVAQAASGLGAPRTDGAETMDTPH